MALKTNMVVLALAAGMALGTGVAGGQAPGAGGAPLNPPKGMVVSGGPEALVTLDFQGGTVEEYVEVMRAGTTAPVNVVYQGGAESARVPRISLKGVDMELALRALEGQWPGRRLVVLDVQPKTAGSARNGGGAPVFAIVQETKAGGSPSEMVSRVLSLNVLTPPTWSGGEQEKGGKSGIATETILTAVEQATDARQEGAAPAALKYHPQSGLLFITGSMQQCKLAEEVVTSLERDLKRERSRKVTQETFSLTHTKASDLADAIRSVMGGDPSRPTGIEVAANEKGTGATVTAPEDMMVAIRAITRLVDRPATKSEEEVKLRLQLEDALRRVHDQEDARREVAAQYEKMRADFENARKAQGDEIRELKRLVDQADGQLATERERRLACEAKRDELQRLLEALQKSVPKP